MANRPVNDKQRRVLDWLSTGATQDPPEPDMKLSAVALKSRGLVKVRRVQGKWTCELTDVGKYYVGHGAYPAEPEEPAQEPATRSGRTAKKPKEKTPGVSIPPSLTDEHASIRITKPHPAVRSLMDRPVALGADPDTRRRGFLAAHMLLRAAVDAGFEVEGHVQPKKRSNDTPYRGERLVTLDAGHQKVIVNIGESMRRTPHVKTAEDRERIAKWGYSWSSSYDYVSSNILCFRVYGTDVYGGKGVKLTETSRKPLTAFVDDVIELVRLGTQRALDWQERLRQMEEERAREAAKARAVAERRAHYERWESVLDEQVAQWERANRLRAYLTAIEAKGQDGARDYLAWAKGLVDQLDPATAVMVPVGDVPDWPHEERFRLGRPQTHTGPNYRGW